MKRSRDVDIENVSVCMKRIARSCATTRVRPFILMICVDFLAEKQFSVHFGVIWSDNLSNLAHFFLLLGDDAQRYAFGIEFVAPLIYSL